NRAIAGIAYRHVRIIQIDLIEGVEEVRLELQPNAFPQREILAQGKVPQITAGPFDDADARRAAARFRRRREGRSIKPLQTRVTPLLVNIASHKIRAPSSERRNQNRSGGGYRRQVMRCLPARDAAHFPTRKRGAANPLKGTEKWDAIGIGGEEDLAAVEI